MSASRHRSSLTESLLNASNFDRHAVSWSAGLMAAIPVVAVLGIPIAAGDPIAGVTMASGAMLVGIAWRVRGGRPPLGAMALDSLSMAVVTFAGCVSGSVLWAHLLVLCVISLLAGLLVGIGNRGGVIGTQAIIAAVVFGRFAEPAHDAAGIAGLVMAGGFAQVLFQAIVKWPSPLRVQRRATATAFRALSALAGTAGSPPSMPAANALDGAREALGAPTLLGDAALVALRSLVDEGHRMRTELVAITTLRERLPTHDSAAVATADVLHRIAVTLELAARVLEGDLGRAGELAAATGSVDRRLEDARERDAFAAGAPAAGLQRRLAALAGQLRAIDALVLSAAHGGGLRSRRPHRATGAPVRELQMQLWQLRNDLRWESPVGRHALRLAIVVPLAVLVASALPLQRGYWMVVSAAAVLRPEYGATFTRGAERALGTTIGVALAGAIAVGLHPGDGATVALVGLFAWLAYSTFAASFAAGFGFITALVVFLLNTISPDTLATAGARLVDTLIGSAFGLLVFALWPSWSAAPARGSLGELVDAQRAYLATVLAAYVTATPPSVTELRNRARRVRLARLNAQATVARSLSEPRERRIDPHRAQGALATVRRLTRATHILRLDALDRPPTTPVPGLAALARRIDALLEIVRTALATSEDPTIGGLPDLRGPYDALAHDGAIAEPDLVPELDEIVDAANSLAAIITRESDAS